MKYENDNMVFTSGRRRYSNGGIVGIDLDSDDVTEGYDGYFWLGGDSHLPSDENNLSDADLVELADHMIERWQRFKAKHARS
jgi:hypothetical protein